MSMTMTRPASTSSTVGYANQPWSAAAKLPNDLPQAVVLLAARDRSIDHRTVPQQVAGSDACPDKATQKTACMHNLRQLACTPLLCNCNACSSSQSHALMHYHMPGSGRDAASQPTLTWMHSCIDRPAGSSSSWSEIQVALFNLRFHFIIRLLCSWWIN